VDPIGRMGGRVSCEGTPEISYLCQSQRKIMVNEQVEKISHWPRDISLRVHIWRKITRGHYSTYSTRD
jgi:hypothetical protein